VPSNAVAIHATASTATPPAAPLRCRAATRLSRNTDSAIRTGTAAASSTATTTAAIEPARPTASRRKRHPVVQQAPVGDQVELPVEERPHAEVEQLDEDRDAQQRSGHDRHDGTGPARQQEQQGRNGQPLHRDPDERTQRQAGVLVRRHQRGEHQRSGQCGEHPPGGAAATAALGRADSRAGSASLMRSGVKIDKTDSFGTVRSDA
jgi:hypothetical protein